MIRQPTNRPRVPGKKGCVRNLPEDQNSLTKTRIATWNVRGLNQHFKLEMLLKEMEKLKINILGLSETHWTTDTPETFEISSCTFIHSCNQQNVKRRGVGMILDAETSKALLDYKLISERLMCITLNTPQGPLSIFQTYAPDSTYQDETYYEFYDLFDDHINKLPVNHKYMIMGDFNAKVGEKPGDIWPGNAGKFGLGEMNDRGQYLLQFCATHNLVISNTLFRHKPIRRATWIHPNGINRNQIDFIITQQKVKSYIKDSRVYNAASIGTDHSLLMTKLNISIKQNRKFYPRRTSKKYYVEIQ